MPEIILEQTNNRLKCLVVDDEAIAIDGVVSYIEKLDYLEVAHTCSSAIEAVNILKEYEIDLMFLDINMPHLSGLEFLESLERAPLAIFTTAYSEYALDGFRLNVVDYLLKPFSFQRFTQATQKALNMFQSRILLHENESSTDIYIRQGNSLQKISWRDVLFAETMQNYLKLHCKDTTYTIHQTMISFEKTLPMGSFFRIHKSFLINISHIERIIGGQLFINGEALPISKYRKKDLLDRIIHKNLISK